MKRQVLSRSKLWATVLSMILAFHPVFAQAQTPQITVTTFRDLVRFASHAEMQEMRVEVFSSTDEKVFDSNFVADQTQDWPMQTRQSQSVESGLYAYAVTVKDHSGVPKQIQRGNVIVDRGREGLEAAPAINRSEARPPESTQPQPTGSWDVEHGTSPYVINAPAMGIGTQDPLSHLHIGAGTAEPITKGSTLLLQEGEATGMVWKSTTGAEMFFSQDKKYGLFGTASNHPLGIRTNNQNRFWIAREGNVGIGTISPSSPLTVAGMIETTHGGIKFPDGTIQTTAANGGDGLTGDPSTLDPKNGSGKIGKEGVKPAGVDGDFDRIHVSGHCGGGVPDVQGAHISWNQLPVSPSQPCGFGETDFINHQGGGPGGFAFMNTKHGIPPLPTLMFISGSGNVGIGTVTPDRSLTVANTTGASNYINIKDGKREVLLGVDGNGAILSAMTNNDLIFRAGNNNDKMRIAANGNVGIGTTAFPAGLGRVLSVAASGLDNGGITVGGSENSEVLYLYANTTSNYGGIQVKRPGVFLDNLVLQEQGGKVGIGTQLPRGALHIANSGDQWSRFNYGTNLLVQNGSVGGNPAIGIFDSGNAHPWAMANAGGELFFSQMPPLGDTTTPPTIRVKIDSAGEVGIGTPDPRALAHLQRAGESNDTIGEEFFDAADLILENSGSRGKRWRIASGALGNLLVLSGVPGADQRPVLTLTPLTSGPTEVPNGGLTIHGFLKLNTVGTNVAPSQDSFFSLGTETNKWLEVWAKRGSIQTSDGRLKQNVTDLRYGLREVMQLRPVSFKWKDGTDARTFLGLIAQETKKVIPEVVEGGDDPSASLGMRYTDLIPVMVKAIQQQQETIDRKDARIEALETKIVAEQKQIDALQRQNEDLDVRITTLERASQRTTFSGRALRSRLRGLEPPMFSVRNPASIERRKTSKRLALTRDSKSSHGTLNAN